MQIIKRPLSILLSLIMILSVFTVVPVVFAGAAETATVSYVNAAGEDMGSKNCTVVGSNDSEWSDGWYAVMNWRHTEKGITVSGTVNLILGDGVQFYAYKGIDLAPGSHLIIWGQSGGTGKLNADGDPNHAGIGGDDSREKRVCGGGTIIINGGIINTVGGTIDISGGEVNANGGEARRRHRGYTGVRLHSARYYARGRQLRRCDPLAQIADDPFAVLRERPRYSALL